MELLFGARERLGVSAIAEMTFRERSTRPTMSGDEPPAGRCSSFDSSVADVKTTKTLLFGKK